MEGQGYKGPLRTPSSGGHPTGWQGAQNSGAPCKNPAVQRFAKGRAKSLPKRLESRQIRPKSEISGGKS
jgi:hypothetical protein